MLSRATIDLNVRGKKSAVKCAGGYFGEGAGAAGGWGGAPGVGLSLGGYLSLSSTSKYAAASSSQYTSGTKNLSCSIHKFTVDAGLTLTYIHKQRRRVLEPPSVA